MATLNDINDPRYCITKKEYNALKKALDNREFAHIDLEASGCIETIVPSPNSIVSFGVYLTLLETNGPGTWIYKINDIMLIPYKGPNNEWKKSVDFVMLHLDQGESNDNQFFYRLI